jgi:transcriptional regulator with XRE-family HTH domain
MNGTELRALRLRHDLTQVELATALQVTQPMISQMERGIRPVPAGERRGEDGQDESIKADPPVREAIDKWLDGDPRRHIKQAPERHGPRLR